MTDATLASAQVGGVASLGFDAALLRRLLPTSAGAVAVVGPLLQFLEGLQWPHNRILWERSQQKQTLGRQGNVSMNPEVTPRRPGPSIAGAIIVGAFVWIVFGNMALGLIAGLIAAGAISASARRQAASKSQSREPDGAA